MPCWLALCALVLWAMARYLGWSWPLTGLHRPTVLQLAYAGAATAAIGWILGLGRLGGPRANFRGEGLRRVALAGFAVWVYRPFLRPEFFGGLDDRWYGYALADALRQVRAGVFPVLVGQSEYLYGGSINPIRLAPYYQYLGMAIDGLTGRALPALAVQHLTVIATAVFSALGCYLCLADLFPARRWLAWAFGALYVSAPAIASCLYTFDMVLTFMAISWIPLVLWANLRLVRRDDWLGWTWLALGLALAWFAHAPLGGWLTLGTCAFQGLRISARDWSWAALSRALGAGLLFVGLTGSFFMAATEPMRGWQAPGARVVFCALALAAGCVALVRWLATLRWPWLALAFLAAGAASRQAPWFAAAVGLSAVAGLAGARLGRLRIRKRLPEWTLAFFLGAGAIALPFMNSASHQPALDFVRGLFPASLLPVSPLGTRLSDFQAGYGLLGGLGIGFAAALARPSWQNRMLALAGVVLCALAVPVPGITRFLICIVPDKLYEISGPLLWMRNLPLLAGVAAFMGFIGAAGFSEGAPRRGAILTGLAILAVGWSLLEAEKFVRCAYRSMDPRQDPEAFYRTENVRTYGYVLGNLPASPYALNGVADYHLESRLLRRDDPSVGLGDGLDWSRVGTALWATRTDAFDPHWVHVAPGIVLAPGERLLLRFKFFDREYSGTLVCRGPGGFYREYSLPSAGFASKSFGVAPDRPKTLAFWNSRSEPQPVEFSFYRYSVPGDGRPFGDFAEVRTLAYDPDALRIRTLGLIPYRAETEVAAPAFLETPRSFIPGYEATVNGRPVPVSESPNQLAMIPLETGANSVELRYRGTRRLRLSMAGSGCVWLGLLAAGIVRRVRRRGENAVERSGGT